MNIGELVATLGADLTQLRAAARQAERHFRDIEQAAQRVSNIPISASTGTLQRGLRDSQRALNDFGKTAKDTTTQFNDDLLKLGRTLASFAAVFYTLKNAFRVFAVGIQFQKVMEDTGLALTGLVASMYDYRDANGKILQGTAAFEAAGMDVIKLQNEMRIAGIETAATYEQLMEAMQQAFAPAKDAGVALGEMVPFVQRLTQVAQTAGVPMHMLNEEIRSFTTGAMTRRTTRIMPFMEEVGLSNEKVKEFIKSGTLFDEVMKRTEQIGLMAAKSMNTWTVTLSNLYDAFQNIMGVGMEATFGALKNIFLELTQAIVQINKETMTLTFNPQFLAAIKTVDANFQSALLSVRNFAIEIAAFQQAHPILTEVSVDIGGITMKLLALGLLVRTVVGIFGFLGKGALGGLKNLGSVIGTVGKYLLMLIPSIKTIELAWIGFRIALLEGMATFKGIGIVATIFRTILAPIVAAATALGAILLVSAKIILVLTALSGILALFGNYTIPNAAAKLWDWIKSWEVFGYTVGDALNTAIVYVSGFFSKLAAYFGVDLPEVVGALGNFFKKDLPNVFNTVVTWFAGFGDSIRTKWNEIVNDLRLIWQGMPDWFKDECDRAKEAFVSFVDSIVNWARNNPIRLDVILNEIKARTPSAEQMAQKTGITVEEVEKAWNTIDLIDPFSNILNPLPGQTQKTLDKVRDITDKALEEINFDMMWRKFSEGGDIAIKEYARRMREDLKQAGQVEPAWVTQILDYAGQKKPKAPEPATGAAGKSAESAINRWRSMMDTLEKEIAKASDNSIAQIDAWSTKFYNDLMQIVAKGEGLISQEEMWQGIIKLNQAVTGKLTDLWEDYTKWYAQNTNNRLEALKMEEREITQKYTDMKNKLGEYQAALAKMPATPPPGVTEATWKEARAALIKKIEGIKKFEESGIKIPVVFETKNIKEFQNLVQNAANAYKEQWSALQGIIPDMAQQAKIGLEIVQLENKISDSKYIQEKLDREILKEYGLWTDEDEKRVKALQEQVKYYKEMKAVVDDLKTGTQGIAGYFSAWSYDRMKDMATRGYESFKEMMDSLERDISDAISAGIIGALRGKKTDFSEMFFSMAEAGVKRAVSGLVTSAFDQLAGVGLGMLGIKFTPKPDGTESKPYWVEIKGGIGDIGDIGDMQGVEYWYGKSVAEGWYGGGQRKEVEEWYGPEVAAGWYDNMASSADNFYSQQANWFTNLLGITSSSQSSLMSSSNNYYNQQVGFFGKLLGSLPGWFGQLFGVIGSFFDALLRGFSGSGGGGGGIGGLLGGLFGGIFGGGGGGGGGAPLMNIGITNPLGIPAFQHGGYVTKPTLALVGEKGPELVVPEKKIAPLMGLMTMGKQGRTEQNININTPIYISAPEPSRFQASREQMDSKRVSAIQRALRNL